MVYMCNLKSVKLIKVSDLKHYKHKRYKKDSVSNSIGSSCIRTTEELLYLDSCETIKEKARWELHKNSGLKGLEKQQQCDHLHPNVTNPANKTNKIRKRLVEKLGQTYGQSSYVDFYIMDTGMSLSPGQLQRFTYISSAGKVSYIFAMEKHYYFL